MSRKRLIISLILKTIVVISAIVGITLSALANEKAFMSGKTVFMFFTVQSNILVAITSFVGALFLLQGKKIDHRWYIFKYVGTVAITLTGVVFCFVLAPTLGGHAWSIQNVLTHVIVPIVSIVDYYVSGLDSDIKKSAVFMVTIPPILYAIYAGIGYAAGWDFALGFNYPYFFLNWGSPAGAFGFTKDLPFMGTFWWIVAILIFLIAIGRIYLGTLDRLKARLKK